MSLRPSFNEQTVLQLLLMHGAGQINLSPGFQRDSVWTLADRRKLIQSIVAGKPLPNIFLYRRVTSDGTNQYDVIDGKQRLETIFGFTRAQGFGKKGFDVKLDLGAGLRSYNWATLRKRHPAVRGAFEAYKIQTVEIEGELAEIIDVFLSINSTGKRLTSGEKRHARYFDSKFLKEAERLVRKYRAFLLQQRVLTQGQIDRMKGVELFSELLISIHMGGIINKKTALDRAIGNDSINAHTLAKIVGEFGATMNLVRQKFPRLRETRLHNSAEFYSLFLLYHEMRRDGVALKNRRADQIAFQLLSNLSTGVDNLKAHLKKATVPKGKASSVYTEYQLTVQGDTDSSANRIRRREILKGLLGTLYERQDSKRLFTPEQRRILWHSDERKLCRACGKPLTWDDLTIDHVRAFARGGKTDLKNAAMMHRSCNSRKGAS